nr:AraC family transcriptional regulator [uncultured Caldimonas sp.]
MPTPASSHRHDVFDTLRTRSRARLEQGASLGDGFAAAVWVNAHDATRYVRPGHHTVSLYLEGGFTTFRPEAPSQRGAPGRLCVMPAEHDSSWVVGSEQRFLHLYFEHERLAPLAVRLLDREPREVRLHELTFFEDASVALPLAAMAQLDWSDVDARLQANGLAHQVLARLVRVHSGRPEGLVPRGGLAPAVRRRLADYVDAHLGSALTVGDLAAQAALSEHHFAHMFRVSFGMAPHTWVLQRRIERARALLGGTELSLDHVAQACGFASASHLVNRFRATQGVPPGRYRRSVRQRPAAQ